MTRSDPFKARDTLQTKAGPVTIYRLDALEKAGLCTLSRLPYSIRVLLEAVLRFAGNGVVTEDDVKSLASWSAKQIPSGEVPFMVGRVLMQDFTGVPAVVDLAAMRGAMKRLGGDPKKINPLIPTELVIDHSVQVDHFGSNDSLDRNEEIEFDRNKERYEFLRWGQTAFNNFLAVPPSTGIVHQVNLEYLARVVQTTEQDGETVAYPDTVVGTDSHTTMVNGLGVLGWGVGGIEAEASMLGQPYYMLAPEVVGVRLDGELADGVLATDLVLYVTEQLRKLGVVGKFVEFHGPGAAQLSLADRATVANMAPEYGATMGFFPVDEQTMAYLRTTGRDENRLDLVEKYLKTQGLFAEKGAPTPEYTTNLTVDMSTVKANLAGPKRPQDRIPLTGMKDGFVKSFSAPVAERGFGQPAGDLAKGRDVSTGNGSARLEQGSVVLAAITSCTNTSNPSVLIGAGILARKAVEKGLKVAPYVKTSLAPGSRVVADYLKDAGLLGSLEQLGFNIVGYGCTTCIGNSGPLPDDVSNAIKEEDLIVSAVVSGNRNFEGRLNQQVKANYLASPPLVVAYALAGTVNKDITTEAIGTGSNGEQVFLKDIWPTTKEINDAVASSVRPEMYKTRYTDVMRANDRWNKINVSGGDLYEWDDKSTYIQEPPYFDDFSLEVGSVSDVKGARALLVLGDSTTTDHISPAGGIAVDSAAGEYLIGNGVTKVDFNSYGARRGNDRVMTRGTFGNIRIKNLMVPGTEGSWTKHLPSGEKLRVYDASMRYREEGVPLVVFGGKEYGTGSSRDWAAKGTFLLGIKAVIAESFERIHRSNLVGMGVLPLVFKDGETLAGHGLTGEEQYDILGISDNMAPMCELTVVAHKDDGSQMSFQVQSRIDTRVEVGYYRNGGIMQTVIRQLMAGN
ncbi:MAG: aconitate hydratase AcnA [Deltaproteobacteria bacterium]|nr:aconitate hydratase AcnA [Deltaproteobacteria bacterium]